MKIKKIFEKGKPANIQHMLNHSGKITQTFKGMKKVKEKGHKNERK